MMGNRVFNEDMKEVVQQAWAYFCSNELNIPFAKSLDIVKYAGIEYLIGEETIFPEEFTNSDINSFIQSRFRLALPDITVYTENLFSPTISNDIIISRSLSGETKSANEMQPINASIDTIDSPTAKAKGISSASEDVTETRPNEIRDNLLMRKEFRNILDILRGIIMPIFKFYTRIY